MTTQRDVPTDRKPDYLGPYGRAWRATRFLRYGLIPDFSRLYLLRLDVPEDSGLFVCYGMPHEPHSSRGYLNVARLRDSSPIPDPDKWDRVDVEMPTRVQVTLNEFPIDESPELYIDLIDGAVKGMVNGVLLPVPGDEWYELVDGILNVKYRRVEDLISPSEFAPKLFIPQELKN